MAGRRTGSKRRIGIQVGQGLKPWESKGTQNPLQAKSRGFMPCRSGNRVKVGGASESLLGLGGQLPSPVVSVLAGKGRGTGLPTTKR